MTSWLLDPKSFLSDTVHSSVFQHAFRVQQPNQRQAPFLQASGKQSTALGHMTQGALFMCHTQSKWHLWESLPTKDAGPPTPTPCGVLDFLYLVKSFLFHSKGWFHDLGKADVPDVS